MAKTTAKASKIEPSDGSRSRPRGVVPTTKPLPGRRFDPERYEESTRAACVAALKRFQPKPEPKSPPKE